MKEKFGDLVSFYNNGFNRNTSEMVQPHDPPDMIQRKEQMFNERISNDRQDKLTRLLFSIGQNLGYKIEQLDVLKGGYHPQAFFDLEREQQIIRQFLLQVASGVRTIPISVTQVQDHGAEAAA